MPTPLDQARLAAKADGRKRYSTGKPCAKGHLADRITSTGKCCECHRLRRMRRYRSNPEHERKKKRDYDARNRDQVNARARDFTARNPQRRRDSVRRWRDANTEKDRASWRSYYHQNADRERDRSRAKRKRRSKAEGFCTIADLRRILKQQRNRCAMCRISFRIIQKHLDHIIPLSKGGTHWPRNRQFLCEPCNLKKHAKDPLDFAREKGFLL